MAGRRAVRAVAVALVLAALAACSPGSSADKASAHVDPTLATDPPRTTTTSPYAVPAVIDAAYVNRVLAGLDAVQGDVIRLMVRTGTIPQEALDRLRAVYGTPELLQFYIDVIQSQIRAGFKNYRPEMGNRASIVTQIVTARPDCVFVELSRDLSAVSIDTSGIVNPQWAALKKLDAASDPKGYNPTSWAFIYDGFTRDRSQPGNPCAS